MNLAAFHTMIDRMLKRPDQTANIADWTAQAANQIETQHTYPWMEKSDVVSLVIGQNYLTMPSTRLKATLWLKLQYATSGGVQYGDPVYAVDEIDVTALTTGAPAGFVDRLSEGRTYLDVIPAQVLEYLRKYAEFTDWPTNTALTPLLLQHAQALLKAETLMVAFQELRNWGEAERWERNRDIALRNMSFAESERRYSNLGPLRMRPVVR